MTMTTLKFKSKSGQLCEIQCEELLEVDGRPYAAGGGDSNELRRLIDYIQGRVDANAEQIAALQRALYPFSHLTVPAEELRDK